MSALASTSVRRTAASLTLLGAGFAFTSGATAWAATPTTTTTAPATCGSPAHPALYKTVHHDAVPAVTHETPVVDHEAVPAVPAAPEVSHVESTTVDGDGTPEGGGWTASGQTTIEDAPARTRYEWQRTVIDQPASPGSDAQPAVTREETVVTPAWTEVVIDSPAVPARPEVSHVVTVVVTPGWAETVVAEGGFAYVQKQTDQVRYESSSAWNGEGNDHGNDFGWFRAPQRDRMVTVWHDAVTREEKVVDSPATEAIPEVSRKIEHEATSVTRTIVDVPAVPAVDPVAEASHPETAWTRTKDVAPEGEGWALTGKEKLRPAKTHIRYEWTRTVVDTPAVAAVPEIPARSHTETVVDVEAVPAWDEQVLVSDAVEAGQPCAGAPAKAAVTHAAITHAAVRHPAVAHAAVTHQAVAAQTLAQTGLDLRLPLGAGIALVFVGGALVAARRVGA